MKIIDYFKMRASYYSQEDNRRITLRITELEEIWNCSNKSVKRRIKLLEDEGRIEYIAGGGRGNVSTIIYNFEFQEEIEAFVEQSISNENLEEIIQLLHLSIPRSWITEVSNYFEVLFGKKSPDNPKEVLKIVLRNNIKTIDPFYASIAHEVFLLKQFGDTLANYDIESDSVKPHIAHNWKVSNDNINWIFYLRKNVYFHNQQLLTSKDVKETYERFKNEDSPYSWLVEEIEHIESLSDFSIEFRLKRSNPFFIRYVCLENLVILPSSEKFNESRWIGSGPFKLKKRTENCMVLSTNKNYFLESPIIDEIEIKVIPHHDKDTSLYELKESSKEYSIQEYHEISSGVDFLCFNFNRKSIVQNPYFREAVYHIIDIGRMMEELGDGGYIEANSFQYSKNIKVIKNRDKVGSLLNKSGYNGEKISFYTTKLIDSRQWIIDRMIGWGINLDYREYSSKEIYTTEIEKEADIILTSETPSTDYHLSFIGMFKNKFSFAYRLFSRDQLLHIETFLEEIKYGQTREVRDQAIEKVENYIRENNLLIFTYHTIKNKKIHSLIKNIQPGSYDYADFSKLWIE